MSIEEIDSSAEGVKDIILEGDNSPLDLHQNNVLEKVDRVAHTAFEHMQQYSLQGCTSPFTWSFFREGLMNNNPITYTASKVFGFVWGTLTLFPSIVLRVAYAPIHWIINIFQSNEFFYFQGQRRVFKEKVEHFAHWDVELYSSYHPLSSQLPFNERATPVIEHIKEVSPDICFLSHVNSISADWLFEGLKGEYADFFVDIGKKGGWSFNGGLFVASKVALSSSPTFYRVKLGNQFNYKGGFFVIETAEQLFIVTDLVHGRCPLVQDLRAAAIHKIVQFLKSEHEIKPIEKTILITGDLAFGKGLELQRLHDRLLEDEQVEVIAEQGTLRVALEPTRHKVFDVSKRSKVDSYAASHSFDQFELTRVPLIEEDIQKEPEEASVPVTQDKIYESGSTLSDPIYTCKERSHEAMGVGLNEEMPYCDRSFDAYGELISEVEVGERDFQGHSVRQSEAPKIVDRSFESSMNRPQPEKPMAPTLFESVGGRLPQAPTLISRTFNGESSQSKEVLPVQERQFEGRGELPVVGPTLIDRPYEAQGERQKDVKTEEVLFNGQAVIVEEVKQIQESFFEGTGKALKNIKEEDQVEAIDRDTSVNHGVEEKEQPIDTPYEPTVDKVIEERYPDKQEGTEDQPIVNQVEVEEQPTDTPDKVKEDSAIEGQPVHEELVVENKEETQPQVEPPRYIIDRLFR